MDDSGCGAAWLARLLGVQEVPSSNLGSPTKFLNDLEPEHFLVNRFWSPVGVQSGRRRPRFFEPTKNCWNSWGLSPPIETRQTRHFGSKLLTWLAKSMSGSLKKPDNHPTFRLENPTFPHQRAATQNPHNTHNLKGRWTLMLQRSGYDESIWSTSDRHIITNRSGACRQPTLRYTAKPFSRLNKPNIASIAAS